LLKHNLKNQDKDVEELRAEDSRQSDRYDELWKAHNVTVPDSKCEISLTTLNLTIISLFDWKF